MNRRSARRLQNFLVFSCIVLSVFLMMTPARWSEAPRGVLLSATAPLELAFSCGFDALAALPQRLSQNSQLLDKNSAISARNEELQHQVEYLQSQIADQQGLIEQLADLKRVVSDVGFQLFPAQIVSKEHVHTLSGPMHSFTIGCGTAAGVRVDDLVVVGYAVVGKVTAVSPSASTVRVITDPDFRIAARTVPSGVEALLVGYGEGRCLLNYVDTLAVVKTGDFVVTSGFEGIHPPRLLLGTVQKVSDSANGRLLYVEVKPAVNLERVSQVIVVRRRPGRG
jgi:rod shape-determining protein MreC